MNSPARLSLVLVLLGAISCGPPGSLRGDAGGGVTGDDATIITPSCGTEQDRTGCDCQTPGETRACYTGPIDTQHVGTCMDGTQTCDATVHEGETFDAPGQWGPCSGDVHPATTETCADGLDHDCDGAGGCSDTGCLTDPMCAMVCHMGQVLPCYTGPGGTSGVGACHPGTQICNAMGQWDPACNGQATPGSTELFHCHDNIDNDCNGHTDCQDFICLLDPGCAPQICTPGATQPCYDGPPGTNGVAACHGGIETCAADGKSWGTCTGQVEPIPEGLHCADGLDNDCNGQIDCMDPACSAAPNCCVPSSGTVDGTIYAHSAYDLYTVNPTGWVVSHVGSFNNGDSITDIAVTPAGVLYGISFSALYRINKTTAQTTFIGGVPGSSNVGMTFLAGGNLLGSDSAGDVKRINPTTAGTTAVGNFQHGLSTAGDLVAISNGTMYGISATYEGGLSAAGDNVLIRVNPVTGEGTIVGPTGFGDVLGLAYVNAKVIGFTQNGEIIEINPLTGAGTLLATRAVAWWGAGMSPLVQPSVCP